MSEGTSRQSSSQKKNTRGITKLEKFVRNAASQPGGKYVVNFNPNTGCVEGDYFSEFASYSSLLARHKVSILTPKWVDVPEQTKNLLWKDLLMIFDIEDTESNKKKWLPHACKYWRDHKSKLSSIYIFGEGDSDGNRSPVNVYPYITQAVWDDFVRIRCSIEFKEKREKSKELASKNLYPHRTSRGGYEKLKKNLPPDQPRHELWKAARTSRETGTISHEPTAAIAQRIDSLVEEADQGTFSIEDPRIDILTTALGTAEHRGRVRTAGHGVGVRSYFGGSSGKNKSGYSKEELDEIVSRRVCAAKEELRAEMMAGLAAERAEMIAEMRAEMMAGMAAERAELKRMYDQQQSVHQEQQQQQLAEIEARPKKASTRASCSPPREDVDDDVDWYAVAMELPTPEHGSWRIPMPSNPDMSISIDKTDLKFIIKRGEWLGECHLSLWLGYLHRITVQNNYEDLFGFIDPWYFIYSAGRWSDVVRSQKRMHRIIAHNTKPCYLGIYGSGQHWSSFVLCPNKHTVYWICSLHHEPAPSDITLVIERAMQVYSYSIGERQKRLNWIYPKGPKQPGQWECGYYCMITLKDIVETMITDNFDKFYDKDTPYSDDEIDNVRDIWMKEFVSKARQYHHHVKLPNEIPSVLGLHL